MTGGTGPGLATVHPEVPDASSLDDGPGVTRPIEVIATRSSTGSICIDTLADTHVIVDVVGHD